MANVFNSVKGLHPRRNAFSAHTYRNDFTAPLGVNIPCYIQHVTAASRVKVSANALVRLQALIAPVMDNIDFYVHFWKIPYRLLENDRFTAFFTGEIGAEDYDALFCTPYELAEAVYNTYDPLTDQYNLIFGNGGLLDMCGYDKGLFPTIDNDQLTGGNNTTVVNWRPLIAYFMLAENWYMNENVPYFSDFVDAVDSLVKNQDLDSLALLLYKTTLIDDTSSFLPHGWEKDYFTSALPNVQFGEPVTLSFAGNAPVTLDSGANIPITIGPVSSSVGLAITSKSGFKFEGDNAFGLDSYVALNSSTAEVLTSQIKDEDQTQSSQPISGISGTLRTSLAGTADLSEASAITINELRFANALQIFKERQLRFGRRRLEFYKGFFDVAPEDLRMQVPKYLGGGRIPINIADIEQTSATSGSDALGSLAGKATAVAGGFAGFNTFCSEESIIIGICFAMPHITYAQQTSRFLLKTDDIYDYFNPSFEHLGEQAIKKIELYAGTNTPDGEFGYTPRYNEYRFHANEMHGEFKDSMSYWSLGRIFSSTPALNRDFIYMQPSAMDRIFAVSNQPNMIVSMIFRTRIIQPVSKFGTPMLLA